MKKILLFFALLMLLATTSIGQVLSQQPRGKKNRAYQWGDIAMSCTANDTEKFRPRPTITSRYLGLIWTAIFDAWSLYDDKAIPVYLNNIKRRPAAERNLQNKELAISYAAYRAMSEYYISDSAMLTKAMRDMGLDPSNHSLDPTTPIGIGNLAAKTVIEKRYSDGSNQNGDMAGSDGKPYADYTAYHPVNNADTLTDLKRWQPK